MIDGREIAQKIAKFRLRNRRGASLISFFTRRARDLIMAGMAMDLIYRYLHFKVPYWVIGIGIVVVLPTFQYFLGLWDERVGFWRFENRYKSKELNPFLESISKKVDKLLDD